ncbi:hypothetical protein ACM66B_003098 [Microbotryomycetes sp. NB124-2]
MSALIHMIRQVREEFWHALADNRLSNFLPEWHLLERNVSLRGGAGLSPSEAHEVVKLAQIVKSVTTTMLQLRTDLQSTIEVADERIHRLLEPEAEIRQIKIDTKLEQTLQDSMSVSPPQLQTLTRILASSAPRSPPAREQWASCTPHQQTNSEEDPRLQAYKQWFLDNFAYPYIDADTRKQLLELVPHHRPQQATTWFINARRRSGWSELFRQHGNSNKDVFKRVLDLADSETNKWQLDEEVRAKIDQVRSWFGRSPGGVVRAGIQSVVDRAEEIVEETQREAEQKRLEKQKVIGLGRPSRHRAHTSIPAYTTSLFEQYMPNTNVDHRNDIHSTDFFAGLLTTPPQRHVSNGSSTDSYRDYSGISPFSVDTDSTGLSSVGNSSPVSHGSAELALPPRPRVAENGDIVITPVTPQYPPQIAQSQYFTTLADWAMAQTTLA